MTDIQSTAVLPVVAVSSASRLTSTRRRALPCVPTSRWYVILWSFPVTIYSYCDFQILKDAAQYCEYRRAKTITLNDVSYYFF